MVASSLTGRTRCIRNGHTRRATPLPGGLIALNLMILALALTRGRKWPLPFLDAAPMFSIEWAGRES